ncbi:MAG: hypothetical protein V1855_00170 [bacterium]
MDNQINVNVATNPLINAKRDASVDQIASAPVLAASATQHNLAMITIVAKHVVNKP